MKASNHERVVIIVIDALQWGHSEPYREVYPSGHWYRGTAPATTTPLSVASLLTGKRVANHSVDKFTDWLSEDTILESQEGVSFSASLSSTATAPIEVNERHDCREPFYWWPFVHDAYFINEPSRPKSAGSSVSDVMNGIESHDVTLLHDFIVHANPASKTTDTMSNRLHADSYADFVKISVSAHRQFIECMKNRDIYDDTLFVVCADHGERLTGENTGHIGVPPFPSVSRVPIGFCSTDSEQSVDRETNPGLIDVVPTLTEATESTDGVDLSSCGSRLRRFCKTGGGLEGTDVPLPAFPDGSAMLSGDGCLVDTGSERVAFGTGESLSADLDNRQAKLDSRWKASH